MQFGTVEREKHIEHMLSGLGFADGEVGLQEVEASGGTVPLRIVARRDDLDDFAQVAVDAEVAGNGNEHIGAISRVVQHGFVDRERAGQVFGFELGARGRELRKHTARDGRSRRFGPGGSGQRFHHGGCGWFLGTEAIE